MKLGQLSGSEAVDGKLFVELGEATTIRRHSVREGGAWADHRGRAEHEAADPHVWLDPENAKAMAQIVARELADVDPANAAGLCGQCGGFRGLGR